MLSIQDKNFIKNITNICSYFIDKRESSYKGFCNSKSVTLSIKFEFSAYKLNPTMPEPAQKSATVSLFLTRANFESKIASDVKQ